MVKISDRQRFILAQIAHGAVLRGYCAEVAPGVYRLMTATLADRGIGHQVIDVLLRHDLIKEECREGNVSTYILTDAGRALLTGMGE